MPDMIVDGGRITKRTKRCDCLPPGWWKRRKLGIGTGSIWTCNCGRSWWLGATGWHRTSAEVLMPEVPTALGYVQLLGTSGSVTLDILSMKLENSELCLTLESMSKERALEIGEGPGFVIVHGNDHKQFSCNLYDFDWYTVYPNMATVDFVWKISQNHQ